MSKFAKVITLHAKTAELIKHNICGMNYTNEFHLQQMLDIYGSTANPTFMHSNSV